jgi:hypothetical protein
MAQWELNYEDREAVRKVIIGRCAQTVRKYALYLLGIAAPAEPVFQEAGHVAETQEQFDERHATWVTAKALYTAQLGWAREAMRNFLGLGEQLSHYVTSDVKFVTGEADGGGNVTRQGGSSISDGDLTGVIEAAINTHFIVVPE